MTTREYGDVVARCPIAGCEIDLLNPEQVAGGNWSGTQEEFIATVVKANEAIILAHAETAHTVHDIMVALGTARQALFDIREATILAVAVDAPSLRARVERGLGGF